MLKTLQGALNRILESVKGLISSGKQISSEVMTAAAAEIRRLTQGIQAIQAGTPQAPPIPPLDKSMDSSVINAFKFDPKKNKLFVQFKGKYPTANGSIYSYDNVPNEIFDLFRKGAIPAKTKGSNRWGQWWKGKHPSMGSSMNVLLKGMGLPYQKLS